VAGLKLGTYTLVITDTRNCEADTLVIIRQPMKLTIARDQQNTVPPFCPDWENGTLAIRVSGGTRDYSFAWTGYGDEADSVLSDIKEGTYTVSITDAKGCNTDTTFKLKAMNSNCLGIPSAFTPNDDEANNTWNISYMIEDGTEIPFNEVYPNGVIQIYDRLGNLIYRCTGGCPAEWNGEDNKGQSLPVDTYYYIIELNNGNGEAPLKGIVTIIR
jgi:gliding motility-associated-like protein